MIVTLISMTVRDCAEAEKNCMAALILVIAVGVVLDAEECAQKTAEPNATMMVIAQALIVTKTIAAAAVAGMKMIDMVAALV